MLPHANHLFEIPTAWHIVLRTLMYSAATLLSTLGGIRGYRGYCRMPFEKQAAQAETLRDEIVFGDEFDKLHLAHDVEGETGGRSGCLSA